MQGEYGFSHWVCIAGREAKHILPYFSVSDSTLRTNYGNLWIVEFHRIVADDKVARFSTSVLQTLRVNAARQHGREAGQLRRRPAGMAGARAMWRQVSSRVRKGQFCGQRQPPLFMTEYMQSKMEEDTLMTAIKNRTKHTNNKELNLCRGIGNFRMCLK